MTISHACILFISTIVCHVHFISWNCFNHFSTLHVWFFEDRKEACWTLPNQAIITTTKGNMNFPGSSSMDRNGGINVWRSSCWSNSWLAKKNPFCGVQYLTHWSSPVSNLCSAQLLQDHWVSYMLLCNNPMLLVSTSSLVKCFRIIWLWRALQHLHSPCSWFSETQFPESYLLQARDIIRQDHPHAQHAAGIWKLQDPHFLRRQVCHFKWTKLVHHLHRFAFLLQNQIR